MNQYPYICQKKKLIKIRTNEQKKTEIIKGMEKLTKARTAKQRAGKITQGNEIL